jgi:hypothetical protein
VQENKVRGRQVRGERETAELTGREQVLLELISAGIANLKPEKIRIADCIRLIELRESVQDSEPVRIVAQWVSE